MTLREQRTNEWRAYDNAHPHIYTDFVRKMLASYDGGRRAWTGYEMRVDFLGEDGFPYGRCWMATMYIDKFVEEYPGFEKLIERRWVPITRPRALNTRAKMDTAFEEFHRTHPEVLKQIVREHRVYPERSTRQVISTLRRRDGLRVNDHHIAYYARIIDKMPGVPAANQGLVPMRSA